MYDRKLLSALSRCAWRVLSVYLRQSVPDDSAAPGAAIAVQTFGEFQNFNPHLHAIASDGCFSDNGVFQVAPGPKPRDLEDLFRYEVLKTEGKITDAVIENMVSWRHSGFNVYCGLAIWPHDENSLENLAHYIIRATFSQERMTYVTEDKSPDGIRLSSHSGIPWTNAPGAIETFAGSTASEQDRKKPATGAIGS